MTAVVQAQSNLPFKVDAVASFDEPWALAFLPDGRMRLHDDGSTPKDNPFVDYVSRDAFADDVGVYGQVWSLGHPNPLGIAFVLNSRLWGAEMGPEGGDDPRLNERAMVLALQPPEL